MSNTTYSEVKECVLIAASSNRDLDQVKADLATKKHLSQYRSTKATEDLPGLGEWYCIECAKWFEGEHNLVAHRKGKNHKRRVRVLRDEAHSQKAAEAAVWISTDNGSRAQKDDLDDTMGSG